MLRSGASRSILRSLNTTSIPAFKVTSSPLHRHMTSQITTYARRPQKLAIAKPLAFATQSLAQNLGLVRWYAERKEVNQINLEKEARYGNQKLEADPAAVTIDSTTRPVLTEVGQEEQEKDDTDMMAGIRADFQTIRDTFSLDDVPREAYYIGLAGVLPYLATSLSTVYCAYEITHAADSGLGWLMSEKTAEIGLHILEPLQIGYGAVIISFLGAIHWGLEWAKYGGEHGYRRYAIGVFSTALAWPTILLPVEYALIGQFLIFNFLYYADSRACKRGWAPPWYGVYRFVLTFIVGGAIVVSLIGRGQIADRIEKLPGAADRIKQLRESQMQNLEEEEEARRRFLVSKDESEEEDGEEGEDEE